MPSLPTLNPNATLDAILSEVIQHFRAETGTIHLVENGMLVLRAMHGAFPPPVVEAIRSIPFGKGIAGAAAERREAITICNIQSDTSGDVRPGAKATGMEGAIAVPMFGADDSVRGTLGIANRAARDWTKDETEMLLTYGRAIAARA